MTMTSNSPISFSSFLTEDALNELVVSEDFSEWLKEYLSERSLTVEFTKKDGSTRRMYCTRSSKIIPQEFQPKSSSTRTNSIPVFDIDVQEWRSFTPSTITRIEWN